MTPPDDRAAVLRRRALFIGSALATLGSCHKNGPVPAVGHGPEVAVPVGTAESAAPLEEPDSGSPPTRAPDPRKRGAMPSLEIPDGVGDTARDHYQRLANLMTRVHGLLDEIEDGTPKCSIESCEGDWQLLAKKLFQLDDSFLFSFGCPGSSDQAKAFAERQAEHMAFYQQRRRDVEARLQSQLGEAGWSKLSGFVEEERLANPRPCLSIACLDW